MGTRSALIKGTLILTFVGALTRMMGFFYRILMSRIFSAEKIGIYQMIFPIYAFIFSLSCAGIQTALSQTTAAYLGNNKKDKAFQTLKLALSISITISLLILLFIRNYASDIANYILNEPQCESLLLIMAYSLPFASIHSCICGFCLGQKNCIPIAYSQFIEQLLRIIAVILLIYFCLKNALPVEIDLAVWGLVVGELSSCAYLCLFYGKNLFSRPFALKGLLSSCGNLFRTAVPLTASRVCINLMHSIESISIPLKLQSYGLDSAAAFSIYGVFSGMALPCILFPSALTNALSSLLLPTVAEYHATKEHFLLKKYLRNIISGCFLMGICCMIFFFSTSSFIGNYIFKNDLAAIYIRALSFLCPFLYANTTLSATLNGLGKTLFTFYINLLSLLIRIIVIHYFVPVSGIKAYFYGLLCSQLFITIFSYSYLYRCMSSDKIHDRI